MNKITRFLGILVVVVGLLAGTGGVARAQDIASSYFSKTGHTVSGDFWAYYQTVSNAEQVFGYPLTEAFNDTKGGRMIQYFTRARFELYPERPAGQRVVLTPLGSKLYAPQAPLNVSTPIGCRAFASGFPVCYDFLDFFDKQGGEAIFGQPISSFESLNGRIVQYFERARFDWYPEMGAGKKVVLADLGRMYFDAAGEDPNRLQAVEYNGRFNPIELRARVFVWKAVTQATDQQIVFVVVQDQTLNPVFNAGVTVSVNWPDGSSQSFPLATDRNGVAIVRFEVQNQLVGSMVTVSVQVLYSNLESKAVTSFRVWR